MLDLNQQPETDALASASQLKRIGTLWVILESLEKAINTDKLRPETYEEGIALVARYSKS